MKKDDFHRFIAESQPNICQVAAYWKDQLVYSDEWNGYHKNDACHVMSATKSIVSLLIGIAIDQGLIRSVDQLVLDFFPEYILKRGEKTLQKVTIKHLLTMTAPYKYQHEPWTKVCTSGDWTVAALDLLGGKKGLTGEFRYSTLGIHILTGILSKTSGMNVIDFANENLFEPIGVERHINYFAKSAEEHKHFTISKEPKENVWFADPKGIGTAGYGLCFSALDMAKIGLLCLNKGVWCGKRIVSSEWIDEMSTSKSVTGKEFREMSYGYLWWVIDSEKHLYAAIGNSGNVIYINPEKEIVISVTSYFKPTVFDRIDFIQKHIEPFIVDKSL